jgi:hypothetical protein
MQGFNFTQIQQEISPALDQILLAAKNPDVHVPYIGSIPLADHFPDFSARNILPLVPPDVLPRIWINGPTRIQTHNDQSFNIACVVAGRRRFVLFPPEQLVNLYIGPIDYTIAGPPVSLARLEEPDFARFPKLRDALATATVAELEPGDGLFLPQYWWHHVTSTESLNILVNYWWSGGGLGFDNPKNAFLATLLGMKDLTPAEKKFWKLMCDHYVFQVDGDPVAHIPEFRRSALGKMSPEMREHFKSVALHFLSVKYPE